MAEWQNVKSSPYSSPLVNAGTSLTVTNTSAILEPCCPTTLVACTNQRFSMLLLVPLSLVCLKSLNKFLWISCEAQGNTHSRVCILLRLSVCQWGNSHRKFSRAEPHSCLGDRFRPPSLFLGLLFFSSFTVCEDSFASAAMMQKHSMNPFIL